MKTVRIIVISAMIPILCIGYYLWLTRPPLISLCQATAIKRVEIANRPLRSVVREILDQAEAQDRKHRKIRVLFAPNSLGDKVRERDGGVFGNSPIEGNADHAFYLVASGYGCQMAYLEGMTILFYSNED